MAPHPHPPTAPVSPLPPLALIGPGKVGTAVCRRLYQAGYPVAAVIGRDQQRAVAACAFIGCPEAAATTDLRRAGQGQVLLLALPDGQLAAVARQLQEAVALPESALLVHFSGLHPAAILRQPQQPCGTVSIHPLLAFADRASAGERLRGCPCAIEGDPDRLAVAQQLVAAWGGTPFVLPSEAKALYHAAACVASNFMVTLTAAAQQLLTHCGFDPAQALQLLLPLHQATSDNLAALGPQAALTGPIVRGDLATVASHLQALAQQAPQFSELYRSLGRHTVDLAQTSGRLEPQQAERLRRLLQDEPDPR